MRLGFLVAALIASTSLAHAQPLTPRLILTLDTSGSMVREIDPTATFGGDWSFGDGVLDNCSAAAPFCGAGNECTAGLDMDGDGLPNDSRVWIAKNAGPGAKDSEDLVLASDIECEVSAAVHRDWDRFWKRVVETVRSIVFFRLVRAQHLQLLLEGSVPQNRPI